MTRNIALVSPRCVKASSYFLLLCVHVYMCGQGSGWTLYKCRCAPQTFLSALTVRRMKPYENHFFMDLVLCTWEQRWEKNAQDKMEEKKKTYLKYRCVAFSLIVFKSSQAITSASNFLNNVTFFDFLTN